MKKLILFGALALMTSSAFVSCGGQSKEEQQRIADSMAKAITMALDTLSMQTIDSTVVAAPVDSAK